MGNQTERSPVPGTESYSLKQLLLWQTFLHNTTSEKEALSNSIELWDAVPKYYITRRRQNKMRKRGYLTTVTKHFQFKGKELLVKIKPARITENGKDIEYFPSAREELVEDALRKIATNPGNGFLDLGRSGVSFTLYELRKKLKKRGHTLSYQQVVQCLDILSGCKVEISPINEKALYKTSPITSLIAVTKTDLKKDPKSRWHVDFSLLVTEGIKNGTYRQFNYGLNMGLKTHLCRWLHKRLSHNYVQASMLYPYTITYRGISRDSGMLECKKFNDNRRKLEEVFDELKDADILMVWVPEDIKKGKGKSIQDITYRLTPSHSFVSEQKKANKRASLGRSYR